MQPLFTPDTLKSLEAIRPLSARYSAVREPDPAACHNLVFSATGAIVDATYPDWVRLVAQTMYSRPDRCLRQCRRRYEIRRKPGQVASKRVNSASAMP